MSPFAYVALAPLALSFVYVHHFAYAQEPKFATLRVTARGLVPGKGQVAYLIFNQKKGFPQNREKALDGALIESPPSDSLSFNFSKLPYGEYAISVFQDLNLNVKLDTNFLGIPLEPVGASLNPRGLFGPPSFKDCVFKIDEDVKTIEIELVK